MLKKPKDSKLWRDSYYHKLFGFKAAQEAERALPIFEKEYPKDKRPRLAIEAIRAWAEDRRKLDVATWYVPAHALGAPLYAQKAISASKNKFSKK